jgi:hypothetical protein
MAYCGAVPAGQHGSHFARERHEREVPHRVDAAMKRVEVVATQSGFDRARTDPHREELLPGDDAELTRGQIADQPVLRHAVAARLPHGQVDNSPFDARGEGVADLVLPCQCQPA